MGKAASRIVKVFLVLVAAQLLPLRPCFAQAVEPQVPNGLSETISQFRRYDANNPNWLNELRAKYTSVSNEQRVAFADWLGDTPNNSDAAARVLVAFLRDPWRAVRRHAAASLVRLGGSAFPEIARRWNHGPWQTKGDEWEAFYLAWVLENTTDDPSYILMPRIIDKNLTSFDETWLSPQSAVWPFEINLSLHVFQKRGIRSSSALMPFILSRNINVSKRAITIASELGADAAPNLEALSSVVDSSNDPSDPWVRKIINLIARFGESGWEQLLTWAIADGPDWRQRAAYEALRDTSGAQEWLWLIITEGHEQKKRLTALRALVDRRSILPEFKPALVRMVEEEGPELSQLAQSALTVLENDARYAASSAAASSAQNRPTNPRRVIDPRTFENRILRLVRRRGDRYDPETIDRVGVIKQAYNRLDLLLRLMRHDEISSKPLVSREICSAITDSDVISVESQIVAANFTWLSVKRILLTCPEIIGSAGSIVVLRRVIQDESGFTESKIVEVMGTGETSAKERVLEALAQLLVSKVDYGTELIPLVVEGLKSKDDILAIWSSGVLAMIGAAAEPALPQLRTNMSSNNENVVAAAANAVTQIVSEGPDWDSAAGKVIEFELGSDISSHFDKLQYYLYPPDVIKVGAEVTTLPPFPWPPPQPAAVALFDRDIPLSLLGERGTTLQGAHYRLARALRSIDPNFESSAFGVPGGFALMTKTEQMNEQGQPAPGLFRWRAFQQPPRSIRDYLYRLFLSPPGFYRTIVFVFTDDRRLRFGQGVLPDFETGEQSLPHNIARTKLADCFSYVLVYSFRRRDLGQPHISRSGRDHASKAIRYYCDLGRQVIRWQNL